MVEAFNLLWVNAKAPELRFYDGHVSVKENKSAYPSRTDSLCQEFTGGYLPVSTGTCLSAQGSLES